ncbi:hypothetical protein, partial [Klebsiella michiganensis]|uniref:hypothetical protein n=1 Tax=Klebsiella michiganensis TaxID=1134687 RepID=UPI003DA774CE
NLKKQPVKAAFLRFERPRLRSRQGLLRGNQLLDVGIPGRQKIDFFTIPCGRHADRFRDALLFTAHNLFGRKIPVKHRRGAGHKKETRYFFQNNINFEATNCAECSHERL